MRCPLAQTSGKAVGQAVWDALGRYGLTHWLTLSPVIGLVALMLLNRIFEVSPVAATDEALSSFVVAHVFLTLVIVMSRACVDLINYWFSNR